MSLGSIDMDAALDRYLTTPPEPKESVFKCDQCKDEFYPGDEYYCIEEENLCYECAFKWLDKMKRTATEEQCYED